MEKGNTTILTVEEEKKLRQPIDEYVGNIQKKNRRAAGGRH